MKETIQELGSLCKVASELERKWDRAGKDCLRSQAVSIEYATVVEEYLASVRRLEKALTIHLIAVTTEAALARKSQEQEHHEPDHLDPAS